MAAFWLHHSMAGGIMMMRTAEDMAQSSRKSETRERPPNPKNQLPPSEQDSFIQRVITHVLGIFYEVPYLKGPTISTLPHGVPGSQHGNCQGTDTDHIQTMVNYNMTLQTNAFYLLCSMTNKNSETEIFSERSEKQNRQLLESSYLYEIFRLKGSKFLSHPTLDSFLVLGLKVPATTAHPLWLTSGWQD